MINDAHFENLPDDDELAFVAFCRRLEKPMLTSTPTPSLQSNVVTEYITSVVAAAQAFSIDEIKDYNIGTILDYTDYREINKRLDVATTKILLKKRSLNSRYSVSFDGSEKNKIHNLIAKIRRLVEASPLSDRKKNALYAKLDAFAEEVDQTNTRFERILSAMVDTAAAFSEAGQYFKPAAEWLLEILQAVGEAKAGGATALPPPPAQKRLPAPK